MKLYYAPAACSMSPHIIATEIGVKLELVKVDLATKKTETGEDFLAINPKGYIPALMLDNGQVVTEGVAIVLHLASLKPELKLAVEPTSPDYLQFLEKLLFITTELHKSIGGLFAPLPEEAKAMMRTRIAARLSYFNTTLAGKEYIHADRFTVADAYAFNVLNWAPMVGIDLSPWSNLVAFQQRIASRPSVQQAMQAEGLLPAKAA